MNKNIIKVFSVILLLLLVFTACSTEGESKSSLEVDDEIEDDSNNAGDNSHNITLTEELNNEDIVLRGQIYTDNNDVICAIIVKDGVNKEEIERLASEYSKKIQKWYKNYTVNIQAVQGDTNVLNIEL